MADPDPSVSGPSAPGTGEATAAQTPRSTRSEAFIWLTVIGLLLLWWTLPLVLAFSGWFDCVGSDPSCRDAIAQKDAAAAIVVGLLVAFTVVAIASMIVGRRRLPRIVLVLSVAALLLGFVSLGVRAALSPWLPVGLWLTIPGAALIAIGSARQVHWYAPRS